MPGPSELFAERLGTAVVGLGSDYQRIACSGETHRVLVGDQVVALDHDAEGEGLLRALGGALPACIDLTRALGAAEMHGLWSALKALHEADRAESVDGLARIGVNPLRVLLARQLEREFHGAGTAARGVIAQFGLRLLAENFILTKELRHEFRIVNAIPRWNTGSDDWSRDDLVAMGRYFETPIGSGAPRLAHIPERQPAGRAVAAFVAAAIGPGCLSKEELYSRLAPFHGRAARLRKLLLDEHVLTEDAGLYMVSVTG